MNVPNWYELLLLALAAWRTWCLVAQDTIIDGPRQWLLEKSKWIKDLVTCAYCSGFWVALIWWGVWQAWPHDVTIAASAVAVTALVPLIEHLSIR